MQIDQKIDFHKVVSLKEFWVKKYICFYEKLTFNSLFKTQQIFLWDYWISYIILSNLQDNGYKF